MKVPPGTHGPYMVAGPGWSGQGHFSGKRTLPCAKKLPGCTLECPLCRRPQRFVAYLPVFSLRATKQPQLVIQGAKRSHATFTQFKFGDIVAVVRGNADRDTALFVASRPDGPTLDLDKFKKRGPQDITRYLLHLWQWRDLTLSFGETFYPSSRSLEIEAGLRSIEDDPPRQFEEE